MSLALLVVLALAFVGVRFFAVAAAGGAIGLAALDAPLDLRRLVQPMEAVLTKPELLAIPLFMATGAILTEGGLAERAIRALRLLLAPVPAGLPIAGVLGAVLFAAVTGSSPVTLIAVGSTLVPALVAAGHPERFAIGLVTTAGSLGCLLPPSIAMLVYAAVVEGPARVDPGRLFLAGLGPAALIVVLLGAYAYRVGRRVAPLAPEAREALGPALRSALPTLALPAIVLGAIYGGLATPSEAGAIALFAALFAARFVHRTLDLRRTIAALGRSVELLGAVFPLLLLALTANELFALFDVPARLTHALAALDLSPLGFVLLVNLFLVLAGAAMDSISATLLFAPVLAPIAVTVYGFQPLHFAIVFVVNMEIGYLAPPVATNLFVASALFRRPFAEVTRAVLPTLGLALVGLAIVILVPGLSLGLVRAQTNLPLPLAFPTERARPAPPPPGSLEDLGQRLKDRLDPKGPAP